MQGTCLGLRVLVVDDSRDNADSLSMLIREFGADVVTRYDGPTAVCAAHAFQPHLVLLDLAMPNVDGFIVGRELRGLPGMHTADIFAVTGLAPSVVNCRMAACGIDLILMKPVAPDLLRDLLIEAWAKFVHSLDAQMIVVPAG